MDSGRPQARAFREQTRMRQADLVSALAERLVLASGVTDRRLGPVRGLCSASRTPAESAGCERMSWAADPVRRRIGAPTDAARVRPPPPRPGRKRPPAGRAPRPRCAGVGRRTSAGRREASYRIGEMTCQQRRQIRDGNQNIDQLAQRHSEHTARHGGVQADQHPLPRDHPEARPALWAGQRPAIPVPNEVAAHVGEDGARGARLQSNDRRGPKACVPVDLHTAPDRPRSRTPNAPRDRPQRVVRKCGTRART